MQAAAAPIRPDTPSHSAPRDRRLLWLGYLVLIVAVMTYYASLLLWGGARGVDYACFRAAAILFGQGRNPYDFGQIGRLENALYNHPGAPYFGLDRYYNPPLFASALTPLARLPFAEGYAIYSAVVVVLAIAGAWLTLTAVGWTTGRIPAVAAVLVSPCLFLTVWNGQQSTLLLFALGGALYALRRGQPSVAGAMLALGWVKPHLLVPIALAAPLLLDRRSAMRWYGGFVIATALGVALTLSTTGATSIVSWLHTLFGYTGYADTLQTYMPSLSGTALIHLDRPWNRSVALVLVLVGAAIVAARIVHSRHRNATLAPWASIGLLVAMWLLFTPFAHTNDDVLLLLPLAVAWKHDELPGPRSLAVTALWAITVLPLAFLLAWPWSLLGLTPPLLVFLAVFHTWTMPERPTASSTSSRSP